MERQQVKAHGHAVCLQKFIDSEQMSVQELMALKERNT